MRQALDRIQRQGRLARDGGRSKAPPLRAFADYLQRRITQPHFANARSVRNALDRMRLRQASRLFADRDRPLTADDLCTLAEADIRASRVFAAPA